MGLGIEKFVARCAVDFPGLCFLEDFARLIVVPLDEVVVRGCMPISELLLSTFGGCIVEFVLFELGDAAGVVVVAADAGPADFDD